MQPQTTSAIIAARKIPSCTASRMLFSVARHGVTSGLSQQPRQLRDVRPLILALNRRGWLNLAA
jgi:hypothetical protein